MIQTHPFEKKSDDNLSLNDFNSTPFNCLSCNSKLLKSWLNQNELILNCENKFCLFPLNSEQMSLFIFDKNKTNETYDKIRNFFKLKKEENQIGQNTMSSSLTNNSFIDHFDSESPIYNKFSQMNNRANTNSHVNMNLYSLHSEDNLFG